MAKHKFSLDERVAQSLEQLQQAAHEHPAICYANSLGAESVVLTDLIWESVPGIEIFSIDTGRLHPETYDLISRLERRYNRRLTLHYPEADALEPWVRANGVNGFRDGPQQREGCCKVRKLDVFSRAIAGRDAWVTGIRRAQSPSRALSAPVEWDGEHGLYKVSPLLEWSADEVWQYIRQKRLPYNALHDQGYPSIGCAPCTRAVEPGEDERAGRWWWERSDVKECGLHSRKRPSLI